MGKTRVNTIHFEYVLAVKSPFVGVTPDCVFSLVHLPCIDIHEDRAEFENRNLQRIVVTYRPKLARQHLMKNCNENKYKIF